MERWLQHAPPRSMERLLRRQKARAHDLAEKCRPRRAREPVLLNDEHLAHERGIVENVHAAPEQPERYDRPVVGRTPACYECPPYS